MRVGDRLSKIVTRGGDGGETGLGDGSRIGKDSPRVRALGEVDELNSSLGVLLVEDLPPLVRNALESIQHDLFDLGGELCLPGREVMKASQVTRLDALVSDLNGGLPGLKEFILPGGTRQAALAHLARTVCRRAERAVVGLGQHDKVGEVPRQYLNRLSDLLFILGRVLNRAGGKEDVQWVKARNA